MTYLSLPFHLFDILSPLLLRSYHYHVKVGHSGGDQMILDCIRDFLRLNITETVLLTDVLRDLLTNLKEIVL